VEVWYYPNGGTSCSAASDCLTDWCSPSTAVNPLRCYQLIPRSDDCSNANAWRYSDPNQRTISLCSGACATVKADAEAKLELIFGCYLLD
jgi:hypothetical protein